MKKYFSSLIVLAIIFSCDKDFSGSKADKIISKAIENAGGENYEDAKIEFVFREKLYTSSRKDGLFEFTRTYDDTILGVTKDVLTNDGLKRYVVGEEVKLTDSLATAIAESVNSVHYFVQLPFGLEGEAVKKELIGVDEIHEKDYYEIQVTFEEEGGGNDHEDIYMYWIEKNDFTIDYMAYRFFVNDGGIRFRVATNPRVINGIRFVDYENYKTNDLATPLEQLDELYDAGALEKVSEIKNEILKVEIED